MNKLDIRAYLAAVYGIGALEVRTMLYQGTHFKNKLNGSTDRSAGFKKAIVTLPAGTEFEWPSPPSEEEGAIPLLPPSASWGKSSARKYRDLIPPPRSDASSTASSVKPVLTFKAMSRKI